MTNLTKKAKLALAGGGAGVLALAVALGIWQPWRAPDAPVEDAVNKEQLGQVVPPAQEKEEGLFLTVGGEKIPCTIYEGDGWSIYVPESWTADAGESGGVFCAAGEQAKLEVIRGGAGSYAGSFVSAFPQHLSETETWQSRLFYTGSADESWQILCSAPEKYWDDHQRLMTALARTFTLGEDKPFSGLSPVASQPDWQIAQGETLLWMDKDAYIVDEVAEEFVVTEMMGWDKETKSLYTGQYDLEPLRWAGSYTCLTDEGYVDVFSTVVRYKVAEGMEDSVVLVGGVSVQDGWLWDGWPMYVVLRHDGSAVAEVRVLRSNDTVPGYPAFAADLVG